jgi:hypothetical protein
MRCGLVADLVVAIIIMVEFFIVGHKLSPVLSSCLD